jgi:hypothetical protein
MHRILSLALFAILTFCTLGQTNTATKTTLINYAEKQITLAHSSDTTEAFKAYVQSLKQGYSNLKKDLFNPKELDSLLYLALKDSTFQTLFKLYTPPPNNGDLIVVDENFNPVEEKEEERKFYVLNTASKTYQHLKKKVAPRKDFLEMLRTIEIVGEISNVVLSYGLDLVLTEEDYHQPYIQEYILLQLYYLDYINFSKKF